MAKPRSAPSNLASESQVRRALREQLSVEHRDDANTLILDELGLCEGQARIDLAVINGSIHGYEIKSERDNLERLANQASVYNRALAYVTFVVAERHLSELQQSWPSWWGLSVIACDGNGVYIDPIRAAQRNPSVDAVAVAQLLWRHEALEVLRTHGLDAGLGRQTRDKLWAVLARQISLEDLHRIAAERLRARTGWRSTGSSSGADLSDLPAN